MSEESTLSRDKNTPPTFDEIAQQIAKEKGIQIRPFTLAEEDPELPLSVIEEDNHKVRMIIKKLEDKHWHPHLQKSVKLYLEVVCKSGSIVDVEKDGSTSNPRSASDYLHNELIRRLFFYQNAVNSIIRYEDYNFSLRKKIIIFLGCRCLFCGSEDIDYLQLDHKNCDGGEEREEFKKRGLNPLLFYWNNLIIAYLRLQVLCIKCHRLKTTYRISQEDIDKKIQDVKN